MSSLLRSGDDRCCFGRAGLCESAVGAADAISGKNIVDANKPQEGLGKVIDGVVACLNAPVWPHK